MSDLDGPQDNNANNIFSDLDGPQDNNANKTFLSDLDSPEDDPASWGDPSYKQTRASSTPARKKGAILENLEKNGLLTLENVFLHYIRCD